MTTVRPPAPPRTDEDIVRDIRAALDALNEATREAARRGLHVEITTIGIRQTDALPFDFYQATAERRTPIIPSPPLPPAKDA